MSTPNLNCNEGASKSNDDGLCEVNDRVKNMSTTDDNDVSICANCGKEGSDVTNTCNKCNSVMYCNAACKKKHRHKHKKQCEEHLRLATERAAELHDQELFKQPPPAEDCPVCFIRMPSLVTGSVYKSCCGKTICSGCVHAPVYDDQGNEVADTCPFCRVPAPKSDEEVNERTLKLVEAKDANAMYNIGCCYFRGDRGFPRNYNKAIELYIRAAELGYAPAYNNLGACYGNGEGVEVDKKKAIHYWEKAAMLGPADARYNLGVFEVQADNTERAKKHWMIAAKDGDSMSLAAIQSLHSAGLVTKEEYTTSLCAYQTYLNEVKSVQRDEAAATREQYRYY